MIIRDWNEIVTPKENEQSLESARTLRDGIEPTISILKCCKQNPQKLSATVGVVKKPDFVKFLHD